MVGVAKNLFTLLMLVFITGQVAAEDTQKLSPQQEAWLSAVNAAVQGPTDVPLVDQAVLHLPPDSMFFPKAESDALMKSWGNSVSDRFVGMVVPKDENANWVITVDHVAEGFVKDDDAKTWNADELLQSLKDGTAEQNKLREEMNIPALDVVGWAKPPHYDTASHQLVWSLKALARGSGAGEPATINYNTYALGRDGYFEVNLLTDENHLASDKPYVDALLKNLEYNQGKRYADFVEGTDRVAEYGLAALVAGVAAKKLGFLAVLGVFFAKFAKLIFIGLAVAGGAFVKFFRRNSA